MLLHALMPLHALMLLRTLRSRSSGAQQSGETTSRMTPYLEDDPVVGAVLGQLQGMDSHETKRGWDGAPSAHRAIDDHYGRFLVCLTENEHRVGTAADETRLGLREAASLPSGPALPGDGWCS